MMNGLEFWRKQRHLTQLQLAQMANCSRNTISAIERGNWLPSVKLAACLASCLRLPITALFSFTDEFTQYNVIEFTECDICPFFECVHCNNEVKHESI